MWTITASLILLMTLQVTTLDRASLAAESFWKQFSAVQCKERVTQTKLKADGKVIASRTEEFDYVAFLKTTHRGLSVEESRVSRSKHLQEEREPLLITSGFPTFLLMFHPEFRDRFDFVEIEAGPDNAVRRINFRLKRGAQSLSALKLKDHIYPIVWTGTAILDAESATIRRIEASLGAPMDDLGLSDLRVEVDYNPVMLPGNSQPFWLPLHATIALKTARQTWQNVHEFLDYKRFSVTTSTRDGEPR